LLLSFLDSLVLRWTAGAAFQVDYYSPHRPPRVKEILYSQHLNVQNAMVKRSPSKLKPKPNPILLPRKFNVEFEAKLLPPS